MDFWDEEDNEDSLGPDSDVLLPCGCVVAINHGDWDWDLSTLCWRHDWEDAIALARG